MRWRRDRGGGVRGGSAAPVPHKGRDLAGRSPAKSLGKRRRRKSCSGGATMAQASWTWMIYLATHNNAAEVGEESVARMRAIAPNKDVRVLVQQSTLERTTRHIIGASPEIAADLGQIDSGAPETLLDFIRWAARTAPAKRYALVLWSHGSGWAPSEMERLAQRQPAAVPV